MSNPAHFCLVSLPAMLRCSGIPLSQRELLISGWGATALLTSESDPGDRVAIAFCELLEMLGTPGLLLDRRGFVLAANALFRRSLGSELQIVNERLASPDTRVNTAVNKLVKAVVNDERQSTPRAFSINRTSDLPIVVYGFQLTNSALELLDPARAILVLIDPRSRSLPSESQLKDAFNLSWMETKLVLCVAGGVSLDAAATTCGVTYESARSLIKSAFHKTGTHRQAELVALIYSIALVPRPIATSVDSTAAFELGIRQASPGGL